MFEKLFLLVKNNAGTAVMDNPVIPEKYRDAVINEASSSIIEVLKSHIDNGKMKDLVKYVQFSGIYNNPLEISVIKKFANKLNKFYGLDPQTALMTANSLIPPVIQQLIGQSKHGQATDFSLSSLLSKINGNKIHIDATDEMMFA